MADDQFEAVGAYKYLLEPVKNLADNYDIDIVLLLEEYIRNGEDESKECDDGRKFFNFTEAALVIHSTAHIYCKKVEYVHQIAYNFFGQLKEDKEKHGLETGSGEDDDLNVPDDNVSIGTKRLQQKPLFNLLSIKNVVEKLNKSCPILPHIPISFIPLADFEKSDMKLSNRTNENETFGRKDDFRVNTCYLHESICLLDLKNIQLVNLFSEFLPENFIDNNSTLNGNFHDETLLAPCTNMENCLPIQNNSIMNSQDICSSIKERDENDPLKLELSDEYMDGLLIHDDLSVNVSVSDRTLVEVNNNIQRRTSTSSHTNSEGFSVARNSSMVASTAFKQHAKESDADLKNSYKLDYRKTLSLNTHEVYERRKNIFEPLDPVAIYHEKRIPFKMNPKCFTEAIKLIQAIERLPKGSQFETAINNTSIKSYIDEKMFRKRLKFRRQSLGLFDLFLMGNAVVCLNNLISCEEARRATFRKKFQKEIQAEERALRRSRRQTLIDPVLFNPLTDQNDENELQPTPVLQNFEEYSSDHDDMDRGLLPDLINEGNNDDEQQLCDLLDIDDLENTLGVRNLYNDFEHLNSKNRFKRRSLKPRNPYDDTCVEGNINPDDLPPRPVSQMEYDDIIAYHLQKYWVSSEENLPKMYDRLQKWEGKTNQLLDFEHEHREFIVKDYTTDLFNIFQGNVGSEIDFAQTFVSAQNYELSRYFLVSLMMTNAEILEIIPSENHSEGHALKLLKGVFENHNDYEQQFHAN